MKIRIAIALAALSFSAWCATSTAWEVSGYTDLLKGRLSGLTLTADGALAPGPGVRFNTGLGQPALWSIAAAPDGTLYGATGHRGKIFRVTPDGKSSLVWSAEQSEIFAICFDSQGILYAGTSPNGGLYRIGSGKATLVWRSTAKYIWALEAAPDGGLYVATGDQGKIFRVDQAGKADVYFETGQANITALALSSSGHLYAGSDPNGLLYDITGPNQGTVLFDSPLPEISSIALNNDGSLYASAMGGSVVSRAATPSATTTSQSTVVATTPTVISVTEGDSNVPAVPKADQPKGTASSALVTGTPTATTVADVSGADKSAVYRIGVDRTVETLRTSKEENVYDLAVKGSSLLFSTDVRGRVYRLDDGKATLLAEPGDGETTRLLNSSTGLALALSSPARILQLDKTGGAKAFYESQVHDSTTVSRWGRLQWHGRGSGIAFRTRSGNATRPDNTWSPWSDPISDPSQASIKSPNARFIQWKAEWPAGSTAELDSVYLPYLPQNTPPVIRSINVASVSGTNALKTSTGGVNASSAFSVTVTDTGDAATATSATSSTQTVSRLNTSQTQISWQADDADGDKLIYSLYFRGEDEKQWKVIRSHIFENTVQLDPDVLAEGRYLFRVVASDSPSNAAEYARQTELVSAPILIDNTPPVITVHPPRRSGNRLDILIDAEDKTSPLRRCEYSLDAGAWQPIEATDGVTDSPHEQFSLHLENLSPGEHLIVFRAYDAANNAGLARAVIE